jgi:hypothetical protein
MPNFGGALSRFDWLPDNQELNQVTPGGLNPDRTELPEPILPGQLRLPQHPWQPGRNSQSARR